MAVSPGQIAFAEELFAELGCRTRRMFGGAGLYAEGVMFGMIDDGELIRLKADGDLAADLEAEGSTEWVYTYPSGPTPHWMSPRSPANGDGAPWTWP